MDQEDISALIEKRKQDRRETRKELMQRRVGGEEISDFTEKKHLPAALVEEDEKLRKLIAETQFVMSKKEIAEKATKLLGKKVAYDRISRIQKRMKQEARAKFKGVDSFEAAFEAFETYANLKDQIGRLILESELIVDPEKRVKTKAQILDKYRQAQEAEDRMFKMAGVHKEELVLSQLDIRDTKQWKAFQSAILVYLRYVLKCPECGNTGFNPQDFLEFIEEVSRNPAYINQFIDRSVRKSVARRKVQRGEVEVYDGVFEEVVGDDVNGTETGEEEYDT